MKKIRLSTKIFAITLLILFTSSSVLVIAQNKFISKSDKMEIINANFDKILNSSNHGARMNAVEHVGRYNLSTFEGKLIDMLYDEEDINDKKIIAQSLFQLGSFESISALKKSLVKIESNEYQKFCSQLLQNYDNYDKLRTEYFETLFASKHENK